MVAPTAGGPARELSGPIPIVQSTTWTQDGGHVLAIAVAGQLEAWSYPIGGGAPEKSPLRMSIAGSDAPMISPDGSQVAFVGGSYKSEIWVMTGLFKDSKSAPAR